VLKCFQDATIQCIQCTQCVQRAQRIRCIQRKRQQVSHHPIQSRVECPRVYHISSISLLYPEPPPPSVASSHQPTPKRQPSQHPRHNQQHYRNNKHRNNILNRVSHIIRPHHIHTNLTLLVFLATPVLAARYVLHERVAIRLSDCDCVWGWCIGWIEGVVGLVGYFRRLRVRVGDELGEGDVIRVRGVGW